MSNEVLTYGDRFDLTLSFANLDELVSFLDKRWDVGKYVFILDTAPGTSRVGCVWSDLETALAAKKGDGLASPLAWVRQDTAEYAKRCGYVRHVA